ncbi:hypothetical protein I4U23_015382 [Adineta vaga]|nr:hypothetical protein I4U23_015382 [Adineta vaga]
MSGTFVSSLTTIFNDVNWSFNYIILPICFILGNIGNCLNLLIFARPTSRSNSCLLYFLSASIIDIFILNFGLVLRLVRGLYNIDPALTSLWFCRLRTYLTSTSFLIYRLSILFACVDRMCASSRSAWMRMESRPKVAYYLIVFIWIFSFVYSSPALIYHTIIYGQCLSPPNSTYAIYTTISALIQGISIPLSMIICGLITFCHLKTMQRRILPTNDVIHNERQIIGQYITMLLAQVITDLLCNILYAVYLIYSLIYPAPQSTQITLIGVFMINMSFTLPYLNFSAAFYLHTLSSPTFRRKLFRLLKRMRWFYRQMPADHDSRTNMHTIPMAAMHAKHTTTLHH